MNKVYQKIVDQGNGDCMKCAIASLLDLEYDDVPHFLEFENPNSEMINFMADRGFEFEGCLYNYPESEYSSVHRLSEEDGIDGLFYASVFSPKYYNEEFGPLGHQVTHAVLINKNFDIVFDPNPEYSGISGYPASDYLGYNGVKNVYLFSRNKESEKSKLEKKITKIIENNSPEVASSEILEELGLSGEYSILVDDVAGFRNELIYMIEQVRYDGGEYSELSSTGVAERFEHRINSLIKNR